MCMNVIYKSPQIPSYQPTTYARGCLAAYFEIGLFLYIPAYLHSKQLNRAGVMMLRVSITSASTVTVLELIASGYLSHNVRQAYLR